MINFFNFVIGSSATFSQGELYQCYDSDTCERSYWLVLKGPDYESSLDYLYSNYDSVNLLNLTESGRWFI